MLPRSTHTRGDREAARGKQSGRTQEIQRLIGRSLRAVVDRAALGEMTITLDCDVLNADGGTRCASITGAWVALALACRHLQRMNVITRSPLTGQVAAVSCGITGGEAVLDLDYEEDSSAEADANFVLTDSGGLVEVQATAVRASFTEPQFPCCALLRHWPTAQAKSPAACSSVVVITVSDTAAALKVSR